MQDKQQVAPENNQQQPHSGALNLAKKTVVSKAYDDFVAKGAAASKPETHVLEDDTFDSIFSEIDSLFADESAQTQSTNTSVNKLETRVQDVQLFSDMPNASIPSANEETLHVNKQTNMVATETLSMSALAANTIAKNEAGEEFDFSFNDNSAITSNITAQLENNTITPVSSLPTQPSNEVPLFASDVDNSSNDENSITNLPQDTQEEVALFATDEGNQVTSKDSGTNDSEQLFTDVDSLFEKPSEESFSFVTATDNPAVTTNNDTSFNETELFANESEQKDEENFKNVTPNNAERKASAVESLFTDIENASQNELQTNEDEFLAFETTDQKDKTAVFAVVEDDATEVLFTETDSQTDISSLFAHEPTTITASESTLLAEQVNSDLVDNAAHSHETLLFSSTEVLAATETPKHAESDIERVNTNDEDTNTANEADVSSLFVAENTEDTKALASDSQKSAITNTENDEQVASLFTTVETETNELALVADNEDSNIDNIASLFDNPAQSEPEVFTENADNDVSSLFSANDSSNTDTLFKRSNECETTEHADSTENIASLFAESAETSEEKAVSSLFVTEDSSQQNDSKSELLFAVDSSNEDVNNKEISYESTQLFSSDDASSGLFENSDVAPVSEPASVSPLAALTEDEFGDTNAMSVATSSTALALGGSSVDASSILAASSAIVSNLDQEKYARLGFFVGQSPLLIPVIEGNLLIDIPSIFKLPNTASWFKGYSNVNGDLIPVFDLLDYLHLPKTDMLDGKSSRYEGEEKLLILLHQDDAAGIIIDSLPRKLSTANARNVPVDTAVENLQPYVNDALEVDGQIWFDINVKNLLDSIETSIS